MIEADTKEETELLNSQIEDKCGDHLEINIRKRRNPRLIIYNIPDALTPENAERRHDNTGPRTEPTNRAHTSYICIRNQKEYKEFSHRSAPTNSQTDNTKQTKIAVDDM